MRHTELEQHMGKWQNNNNTQKSKQTMTPQYIQLNTGAKEIKQLNPGAQSCTIVLYSKLFRSLLPIPNIFRVNYGLVVLLDLIC